MKKSVLLFLILTITSLTSACSVNPKHAELLAMQPTAPAGNVEFQVVDNGQYKARFTCPGDRPEKIARNLSMDAFGKLPGRYKVTIQRTGFYHFACYDKPTVVNLLQDLTIVGLLFPNIHYTYTRYNVQVYKNGQPIYQNTVDRSEKSTKFDLNVAGVKELNEEAVDLFIESFREDLTKAAAVAASRA